MRDSILAWVAIALFLVGMSFYAKLGHARQVCVDYDEVLELLAAKYGEAPVAQGVDADGNLTQVLANANGSTWTILVVHPTNNVACAVGAGEDWESVDWKEPIKAKPQSF